jgi:CRP-like cAMP-binding protein
VSDRTFAHNHLLLHLHGSDRVLLEPHLERVDLPLRKQLEARNKRIDHAYFLEEGIASVVANGANDTSIEVGLIGSEGMTGLAVVMGVDHAAHSTYMQVAGSANRIPAEALRQAMQQSSQLQHTFLRFAHAFFIQISYTALSNGRSNVGARLARWLLMAQDRIRGDELPLTHEFLSIMLGVRRAGVTIALQVLAERGLIRSQRRSIRIVDREGLKKASNGAYGPSEIEFEKLLGNKDLPPPPQSAGYLDVR